MNIEEWRTIENYEGLYMVSNLGRVKSLCGFNGKQYVKREKILKPTFEKINKNSNYIRLKVKLTKNKQRKQWWIDQDLNLGCPLGRRIYSPVQ